MNECSSKEKIKIEGLPFPSSLDNQAQDIARIENSTVVMREESAFTLIILIPHPVRLMGTDLIHPGLPGWLFPSYKLPSNTIGH